ncbi:MAG: hypothetical protein VX777_06630 [Chlamydiota bacterium]|nr:hypothetical protein [Chlamydiota bacterium]
MKIQNKIVPFFFYVAICFLVSFSAFSENYDDIIIITTNTESQSSYWQSFFEENNKNQERLYIVLNEDWPGGADNGLGSLYAYKQAYERALTQHQLDLMQVIENGGRVSLLHCAGMGKRLYPLTASEYNNKSAIKVPSGECEKSILELVLEQTMRQTDTLKGRFSVFWGDQIFQASEALILPSSHVEVLSKVSAFPTEEEWNDKNLSSYGLIILNSDGSSKLVEKTTYEGLNAIVGKGNTPKIGVSLGSFSITGSLLSILMKTFENELCKKVGQLNTDYHFWMPLTWARDEYCKFMTEKGTELSFASDIYNRMCSVKDELQKKSTKTIFGVQNIGKEALWWDFGNLQCFYNNLESLVDRSSRSGQELFKILDLGSYYDPQNNNIIINANIKDNDVKNSIIMNVEGNELQGQGAVIINSKIDRMHVEKAIVYNCEEMSPCVVAPTEVRAYIFFDRDPKHVKCYTQFTRNNKIDWSVTLPKNLFSFEDIYYMHEVQYENDESSDQ